MSPHPELARRTVAGLLLLGSLMGITVAGCSGVQPEPDDNETAGEIESPTHEQDEERHEDRGRL